MALQEERLHSNAELILLGIDHFLALLGEVDGRRWKEGKGHPPIYNQEAPAPEEWIPLALTGFADLLATVCQGMPFRQFVETILNSIPAGDDGRRMLAHAKIRARKRWTNLYEIDCQSVGAWFREAAATLSEHQRSLRERQESADAHEEARVRMEIARQPVPFMYQKRNYHFPYRQSVLLSLLRDQKARSVLEVIDELWIGTWRRKQVKCKNRLHQLQRDTNAALNERGLPFQIRRPVANQIQLCRKKTKGWLRPP
jgi:hypothetical protein